MALAFATDTINGGSAGAVGQLMIERLRDELVAHAAWELVEEYDPGSISRWYVFRCLASVSGLPADFYFLCQRNLGDGSLRMFIAEGYNAATHQVTKFAAGHNTGTQPYGADGNATNTSMTLGATALGVTTAITNPYHVHWLPSGVSTKYWSIIDDDGFTVAFNGASNGFFHCGKFDWLAQIPNVMPLHFTGTNSNTNANAHRGAGITRNPALANVATGPLNGLQVNAQPGSGSNQFPTPSRILGFAGRLDVNDAFLGGERSVAELPLWIDGSTPGSSSDSSIVGQFMGKIKRCRWGTDPPAGVSFGDAYVNNGTLWVPVHPTVGVMFDTGVAA